MPFANIAITHDDNWITMLEEVCWDPIRRKVLTSVYPRICFNPRTLRRKVVETLWSQKYNIISDGGGYLYRHPIATDTHAYRCGVFLKSKVCLLLVFDLNSLCQKQ